MGAWRVKLRPFAILFRYKKRSVSKGEQKMPERISSVIGSLNSICK